MQVGAIKSGSIHFKLFLKNNNNRGIIRRAIYNIKFY